MKLLSPSLKNEKKFFPKKISYISIFQQLELSNSEIKKFLIFREMELSSLKIKKFLIFPEKETF